MEWIVLGLGYLHFLGQCFLCHSYTDLIDSRTGRLQLVFVLEFVVPVLGVSKLSVEFHLFMQNFQQLFQLVLAVVLRSGFEFELAFSLEFHD